MDPHERIRYARHLALPEIGESGQQRLREASVLVVGLGGLGSAVTLYLAAAGVGRLLLNDFDLVDPTNLQRQLLYTDADVGVRKVDAACAFLDARYPGLDLVRHDGRLDARALESVMNGADVVLDCSDNFGTRFSLNRASVATHTPLVSGAAVRLGGQVASFSGDGPCYACVFEEDAETAEDCAGNGVLAPLVGVIGAMQAVEAVRILCAIGAPAHGRLLQLDAATMAWRESAFARDRGCTVCG